MTYYCHLKVSYYSFNEITKSATGNQVLTDLQNEFTSLPAHYRAENIIIAGTWSTSHKTRVVGNKNTSMSDKQRAENWFCPLIYLKFCKESKSLGSIWKLSPPTDFISVLILPITKGKRSSAVIHCGFHHLSEASLHQQEDETKIKLIGQFFTPNQRPRFKNTSQPTKLEQPSQTITQ